jgi:hypothetical protein
MTATCGRRLRHPVWPVLASGLSGVSDVASAARGSVVIQMVRVVQTEPAALGLELVWREAFQRRLCCNGHEDGERYRPVGQMQRCGARFGDLRGTLEAVCGGAGEPTHRAFPQQLKGKR